MTTHTRNQAHGLAGPPEAVHLSAHLEPDLSRWKWLIKWILAIPHVAVLAFLWLTFAVATAVAGLAILVTGRYPRGLFDLNVGVLRWTWRVQFYAGTGGLGTDRYPHFALEQRPTDVAHFDVDYPQALDRRLVLTKWLLAIPHIVIVALITGATFGWLGLLSWGGALGLLTVASGLMLLITGKHAQPLFDVTVGLNRWVYRVIAYLALLTDEYPPFRLDQGGADPAAVADRRLPPLSRHEAYALSLLPLRAPEGLGLG